MPIILVQIVVVLSLAVGLNSFVLPANLLRSNWRPSRPLEGSCNLALFQRSWQRQQIQGRFKHGKQDKPHKVEVGRLHCSCSACSSSSSYISKKQEKKTHRLGSQVHTLGQNHSQFLQRPSILVNQIENLSRRMLGPSTS